MDTGWSHIMPNRDDVPQTVEAALDNGANGLGCTAITAATATESHWRGAVAGSGWVKSRASSVARDAAAGSAEIICVSC